MDQRNGVMYKSDLKPTCSGGFTKVPTDEEAATDLTTLLIEIFNRDERLQKSPLFIVAESYGGKFAVTLGLSALKAIQDKKLKLILGGVALGDSWISPEDYVVCNIMCFFFLAVELSRY
ncbi:PREDICTED: serine carboxypeptidase-like 51 [Lupinus angustifolius]|uniref:serine carboxypeptidase-like 51 n=1 Tax=Lupinus angustifolius TaxID=3871 RepID=UPI00092FD236|nr:PREDICTED: serine carboxypeptidase-like 51 [Lupinus angustifolius]